MNRFQSLRCLQKCLDKITKSIMPKFSKLYISTQKKPLSLFYIIVLTLDAKFDYDTSIPAFLLQISTQ